MSPDTVLHIALQDGFDGDAVVVLVDGVEVYRRENVTSDPRISLADSFDVSAADGPVELEVRLPNRGVRRSLELDVGGTLYLGISWDNGAIDFRPSETPFGYA